MIPDVNIANEVLHPNTKVASVGFIKQPNHTDPQGIFAFEINATLYHGMSGGPAVLIKNNTIGIAGQVVGFIATENKNGNTLLNLHHPEVLAFLAPYSQ